MLHITICDDEHWIIDKVKRIVEEEMCRQKSSVCIDTFSNGAEFLSQYQIRDNELIILDIDMPIKTGLDVIEELEQFNRNKNIILITNHDHMVLESLSYAPLQIIRKANMERDIPRAIDRYVKSRKQNASVVELVIKGAIYHIKKKHIAYIEKYRHHLIIHHTGNQVITIRGNMQDYETNLAGGGFVRIHTGYIVNLQYCNFIEKGQMVLADGTRIPISRERHKSVKEQFMISRRK